MTIAVIPKRLYQAPRNRVYQKSFHVQLFGVLVCLLAALAFSGLYGAPAWAQKAAGKQELSAVNPQLPSIGPMDLERYFAEGYSIYGPARLDSVSSKALVFPGEHDQKGLTISLLNKAVVVMDQVENAKSFSALGPGVSVIVCSRQDRVVIYIVTPQQGRSRYVR